MDSALAVSFAIDDPEKLIAELTSQIHTNIPSLTNGCGILLIEPLSAIDEISPALSRELNIPIIGCTSSAQLSSLGYHTNSATLLVLHKEDCCFGTAITPPVHDPNKAKEYLSKAFAEAKTQLGSTTLECVFAFSARDDAVADEFRLNILSELSQGKPVFGGVAADYLQFTHDVVFLNNTIAKGGIALLLIGGNIHPQFVVHNLPPSRLAQHTVTKATGNTLESIDGLTTANFLQKKHFDISPAGLLHAPLRVRLKDPVSGMTEEYIRHIISIDPTTGFGNVSGDLPAGTEVAMQFVQPEDIIASTKAAMLEAVETLQKEAQKEPAQERRCKTAFCISCAARHVILGPDASKEGTLATDMFGDNINFAGFYSMGEFCPSFFWDNKAHNRLHQLSMVICLL